jgi:hypothetical protein
MKRWNSLWASLSKRKHVPELPNEVLFIIFAKVDYVALTKYVSSLESLCVNMLHLKLEHLSIVMHVHNRRT